MEKIVIAIDGPAGAGKSTIAKIIADKLNILYIDTGAMYRAVTLSMIRNKIDIGDIESIGDLLNDIDLKLIGSKVFMNGEDVTDDIRYPEVTSFVSPVSALLIVRQKLVDMQRKMAMNNSVIMDGRDIGTNVLKDADVKIFLTASVEERAERRYSEMKNKGLNVDIDSIKSEILQRDMIDSNRKVNPLRRAEDALVVDTTRKSIDTVVEEILSIVREVRSCSTV